MKIDVHWWREGTGIRYGRLAGRVSSGGWRWRSSSHGDVWLWLNRTGRGLIWGRGERFMLHPGMYALTGGEDLDEWTCVRYPGPHEMELVRLSRDWLAANFGKQTECLHPDLARWLKGGDRLAFCGLMGVWEHDLCAALADAAIDGGGKELLAEARFLEWLGNRA
jgi:hypothetical protein